VDSILFHPSESRETGHPKSPRREVFIWVVAILLSNQLFYVIKEGGSTSLEKLIYDLGAIGAFQFMAWYVVFDLLRDSDPVSVARWRDLLVTRDAMPIPPLAHESSNLGCGARYCDLSVYLQQWRSPIASRCNRSCGIVGATVLGSHFL
jgi:hypothetical protein